ncbi:hypothetical protein I6E81_00505 [Salinibacterium sp. NG22]|uniref:hypothetical protein n=1 Tax=Salinibacterium sp. NG22 TaxID=2792040 RepID=UPI0018CF13B4|nr:hypothetical protein [Salinibacterium sp. NG22]MBH0108643.1 hypothetical protein [Salinibacterium sp. NG22]
MSEVSLLIYPWDVIADGPERVVETVAELGVDRLVIATAYHSAEVISPRRFDRVSTVAEANTSHLPLGFNNFSGLAVPPSSIATEHPDLYPSLKRAADVAGVALSGWGIAFHNTTMATEHPEAAIKNCFGDAFTHGLCPANPAAQQYAVELVGEIAGSGLFDRVLVESLSYLLYNHGHPHELWGARLDPTTRYLLSLCFCSHCREQGTARGVDVGALRLRVSQELHRTWNAEAPAGRDADDGAEIASLHMMWPDLAAYTRMRNDVVTELAGRVAREIRSKGAVLDLSAAVWGRPAFSNWMEGVDVAASVAVADSFVLESYYPTAGEVARELDHTLAAAALSDRGAESLASAITLWTSFHPTKDSFLSKVDAIRGSGVSKLALYNYGTATAPTLSWIRDAADMMRSGS